MQFGKAVKKPIPIDWFRFNIKDKQPLINWVESFYQKFHDHFDIIDDAVYVKTMEGHSYGVPDGYIVLRGIKGEFYPCDPQVFIDSYDVL